DGVEAVDRDRGEREPRSGPSVDLEANRAPRVRETGRRELDEHDAVRAQQRRDSLYEDRRLAADADVAVEQQRARPTAGTGDTIEHRTSEHGCATRPCDFERARRHVDAERADAAFTEGDDVASRPAAHVERRPAGWRQHARVGSAGAVEPTVGVDVEATLIRADQARRQCGCRHATSAIAVDDTRRYTAANREAGAMVATAAASAWSSTSRSTGNRATRWPSSV